MMREFDATSLPRPREPEFARAREFLAHASQLGPVDLEIGCGVGWHPIQYTKANPDRSLIAIEHTRDKFESFKRRVARHPHTTNLLAVHANGISWVAHCLPPQTIERVFFLYPNPNLKSTNQRWHRMPFFGFLLTRLKRGGLVTLATNIEDYALDAHAWFRNEWGLTALSTAGEIYRGPVRTHFEKKYRLRGEKLFELRFQKST